MTFYMYHYYDLDIGPFRNLSMLSEAEADNISARIKREGTTFASQRSNDYMIIRRQLESAARELFIAKGGRPQNRFPHYMTLEACDWLATWYRNPGTVAISWDEFSDESISFTYGDLFPTMRYQDDKPYRRQVYTKKEIIEIISQFGFPQHWNNSGNQGPERYIEVQIWDEEVIKRYF